MKSGFLAALASLCILPGHAFYYTFVRVESTSSGVKSILAVVDGLKDKFECQIDLKTYSCSSNGVDVKVKLTEDKGRKIAKVRVVKGDFKGKTKAVLYEKNHSGHIKKDFYRYTTNEVTKSIQ